MPFGSDEPGQGRSDPWQRCYEGFAASGDPRVDVQRLGVACGPSNGMLPLAEVLEVRVDEGTQEVRRVLHSEGGVCYRFIASAEKSVEDLEIEVMDQNGEARALGSFGERWVVAPPEAPFCPSRTEATAVVVRAHGGQGRVALARWYLP